MTIIEKKPQVCPLGICSFAIIVYDATSIGETNRTSERITQWPSSCSCSVVVTVTIALK